uniref:AAA+ ATPase domain-containing protein n=1 Tax=Cliftonaea pectinata TaxID=2007206 RepID=A0A1Z1MPI2_9FLOR|nr:hypothetical protein [Cliftonaea pectinata]ARW67997.1 hypothetical protein [Cliftonaea pectinata]
MLIADDLDKLLDILPDFVKSPLNLHPNKKFLIEVVMDLGRKPEARFPDGPEYLSNVNISWYDLDFCIKKIPNFSSDNRSGIECTLHRISSIKNRKGNIIGLTCRVGRAIFGTISIMRDLLYDGKSILLLGKPGVGKTTAIREITRVLADEMEKRVVIIDTSNEIAGDGDIPHPAIGRARRMQVARPELQHQVMIEAVENHMPEVIIIDEIGTELEALAARTIAERGVQLVGTAHGNYLQSVIKNPILSDLIGGIQYVTLGDDEAKRRGSQKSILERKAIPAFQVAVEIHQRNNLVIHEKVDQVVDQILQGSIISLQRRKYSCDGSIFIECEASDSADFVTHSKFSPGSNVKIKKKFSHVNLLSSSYNSSRRTANFDEKLKNRLVVDKYRSKSKNIFFDISPISLYVHGINIQQIEATINKFNLSISLTRDIVKADSILALRSSIKHDSKIRQIAKFKQIVIYTIHNNTISNIARALKQMLTLHKVSKFDWDKFCLDRSQLELEALLETRIAIERIVLIQKQSVELLPQIYSIRGLQHQLIKIYNLKYYSSVVGSKHRLIIYPK